METNGESHPKVCPKCGADTIMVEYGLMDKYHYDGVSEIACVNALIENPTCDWRIGRWCGQELHGHEVEKPFCDGKRGHPSVHTI